VTLALAFATAPLALVLSFLLAWGKNARSPIARWFAFGSTTVFRSLPELLTLVIIYYQLQLLIDWVVHFAFPNASISLKA
ncbi:ABC transporter permease, partial [Rhizobium ruizarguesonis]